MEKRIILAFFLSMVLISLYNALFLAPLKGKKGLSPNVANVELPLGEKQKKSSPIEDISTLFPEAPSDERAILQELAVKDGRWSFSRRGIYKVEGQIPLSSLPIDISFDPPVFYGAEIRDIKERGNWAVEVYLGISGKGQWIAGPSLEHPKDLPKRYLKYNEGVILVYAHERNNLSVKRLPLYKAKEGLRLKTGLIGVGLYSKYFLSYLHLDGVRVKDLRLFSRPDRFGLVLFVDTDVQKVPRAVFYTGLARKEFLKGLSEGKFLVKSSWTAGITQVLWQILKVCYLLVRQWGLAIILLALGFSGIFLPLTVRSYRAMHKMQAMQPEMKALQEKYKDDPTKLNQEIMLLYSKYGVNPLSGCLPLLLQLPVFFALYPLLLNTYEFKGSSFLWIKDLSRPDVLFAIGGFEVHLLPILVGALMLLQQRVSLAKTGNSSNTAAMQFLPLLFVFIFYNMPSGLVLFWFVLSCANLIQQIYISRAIKG